MTPEEIAAAEAAKKKAPAAKARTKEPAKPKETEKAKEPEKTKEPEKAGEADAGGAGGDAGNEKAAPAAKSGTPVLADVLYNGKLYRPGGKPLPADVPEKTLGRLKALGFI